jgi:hypothetical protein
MKGKVKKIIGENRREFKSTGGGPNKNKQLTPLQQEIDILLNISEAINPAGNSFECTEDFETNNNIFPSSSAVLVDDFEIILTTSPGTNEADRNEADQNQDVNTHSTSRRPKRRQAAIEERSVLLKKQTDLQEETLKKN